jgi:putative acetyltransferase
VLIRPEEERDRAAVDAVNVAAFDRSDEAELVAALRAQVPDAISLVAEEGEAVIGHILFTPVTLGGHPDLSIMGLAPMAVAPAHQRSGVGSALVRAGLEACRERAAGAVVVLGHAEYYPRFGFVPASRFGIASEYDVPDDVFLILELRPGSLASASGTIRYHAAFGSVSA